VRLGGLDIQREIRLPAARPDVDLLLSRFRAGAPGHDAARAHRHVIDLVAAVRPDLGEKRPGNDQNGRVHREEYFLQMRLLVL